MDILTMLAHEQYWGTLTDMDPVLRMLFLRWATIMVSLLIGGLTVRYWCYQHLSRHTLAAQVIAFFVALVFGFWFPLEGLNNLEANLRNTLLSAALIGWAVLPYFIPRLLIRRLGTVQLVWPCLYGLELMLLLIQLFVLGE